jgi:hypothetical protein
MPPAESPVPGPDWSESRGTDRSASRPGRARGASELAGAVGAELADGG